MTLTADTLIAYLRNDLNLEDDIAPETELFSSGLLDSVAMMTIIAFVEEQAGIENRGRETAPHPLQPDRDPIGLEQRDEPAGNH